MTEPIYFSASQLARLIRTRQMSVEEVVRMYLARIDAVNDVLNAVITRCDEMALDLARAADAVLARREDVGPLHGVPITIKDSFDTAGVRTTGATKGRTGHVPVNNATAVDRLLAAGAILIGKTNTSELTLHYDTDNLMFGKTHNPYDPNLSPGGSSGGAAAIVAAGGSALDLGSDTGGSIRLPAHFCGVAGIKPTAGRVPRTGLVVPMGVPIDPLTQVGPIARFTEDLALVLPIISGVDWTDSSVIPMSLGGPSTVRIEELRVAFYTDNGLVRATREVADVVENCARVIAGRGASVAAESPRIGERSRDLFARLFRTDGAAWVRRIFKEVGTNEPSPYFAWAYDRVDEAAGTASEFVALLEECERFRRDVLVLSRDYDVFLAPVHTHPALPHDELISELNRPAFSFCQTFNLTGWPCVVVRAGTSDSGLPIGIQIVARPWREDVAIAVASFLEREVGGWRPPSA